MTFYSIIPAMDKNTKNTNNSKDTQIKREAIASIICVAAIVVFWCISGLAISTLDIVIFHTPLWIITGCLGTWIFASVLVAVVVKKVFKNTDLEGETE